MMLLGKLSLNIDITETSSTQHCIILYALYKHEVKGHVYAHSHVTNVYSTSHVHAPVKTKHTDSSFIFISNERLTTSPVAELVSYSQRHGV